MVASKATISVIQRKVVVAILKVIKAPPPPFKVEDGPLESPSNLSQQDPAPPKVGQRTFHIHPFFVLMQQFHKGESSINLHNCMWYMDMK